MVFDIRGKRRHVVKVVYGILAVLMGASLFLVVGPVNIGSLLGTNSSSGSNLAAEYEKRAEKIEFELQKQPGDEELLAKLTNARMNAGQQSFAVTETGETLATVQSRTQYQKASAAWSEYLEATQEPTANLSQKMANVLFSLAQYSRTYPEAQSNIDAAAEAQKLYAEARPTLNSLSTLALYELYAGNTKAAEAANKEAEAKATSKFQREQVGNQFDSTKKTAAAFQKERSEAEKAGKEAAEAKKANPEGSEGAETPIGPSLGGAGSLAE
jgi:hypothetical protein